jgi:hypothetical protein
MHGSVGKERHEPEETPGPAASLPIREGPLWAHSGGEVIKISPSTSTGARRLPAAARSARILSSPRPRRGAEGAEAVITPLHE